MHKGYLHLWKKLSHYKRGGAAHGQWDDHPFPRPPLHALLENDLSTQAVKIVFLSDEVSVFD